ncbi:MAG: hypothetical protein KJZ93_01080 [Caldilineaceae bacterium]|nr:hypothetical protein [Caldilineaceae bacterium]
MKGNSAILDEHNESTVSTFEHAGAELAGRQRPSKPEPPTTAQLLSRAL